MSRSVSEVLSKRGIRHKADVSGASLCSFRIGGRVAALVEPTCIGELIEAVRVCLQEGLSFEVIGQGSNLLIGDGAVPTVLIRTTALNAIRCFSGRRLYGLCGASLAALCQRAAKEGLDGLTFAAGIPGTLGGAVCMNAGAHGRSISELVESVTVLRLESGEMQTLFNRELNFSYRNSEIQRKKLVVLSAMLRLPREAEPATILAKMNDLTAARRATQPLDMPSAGSVFRRPAPDYPLSAELDRLGLKGLRVGGAAISEKHAGFIVNRGGATAADVKALMRQIQDIVEKERGFRPEPEIRLIPEEI